MAIVIRKLKDFKIDNDYPVKLKQTGNISEILFSQRKNRFCPIRLIDKNHYVRIDFNTGEISDLYDCNHIENRSQSYQQVKQTQKRLRDIINTNVIDTSQWKWITLTYKENMTDTKRLYKDYQRFIRAFRNKYQEYNIEYIIACEPQGRGAWHIHALIGFNAKVPYIPNTYIQKLWGQGYTKTQKLKDIDNVGAYLSAYLSDMEFTQQNIQLLEETGLKMPKIMLKEEIKEVKNKKFLKGSRLYMYPPKFNMYRCSKGIKKPISEEMDYFDAKIKVGITEQPTYTKSLYLEDIDNKFSNTICYEYYNKTRK